jgi:hypothetical protein
VAEVPAPRVGSIRLRAMWDTCARRFRAIRIKGRLRSRMTTVDLSIFAIKGRMHLHVPILDPYGPKLSLSNTPALGKSDN